MEISQVESGLCLLWFHLFALRQVLPQLFWTSYLRFFSQGSILFATNFQLSNSHTRYCESLIRPLNLEEMGERYRQMYSEFELTQSLAFFSLNMYRILRK